MNDRSMKREELITKMIPHAQNICFGLDDKEIPVWEFTDGRYTVRLQDYLVACSVMAWNLRVAQSAIFKSQSLENPYLTGEEALSKWIEFRDELEALCKN